MGSWESSAASCLCCPCKCLACALLACLCSILASLLVAIGALALVLYLLLRPHAIAATADSASLARFTLAHGGAAGTLRYNLTVAMTVRNRNRRVGLYYDGVESLALFEGQRFGYAQLGSFYQPAAASTRVAPEFHGKQPLEGHVAADDFRSQQSGGVFSVDVKLDAKLRVKVWVFKVSGPKARVTCPLSIPAPGNSSTVFQPTGCRVWF